MKDLRIFETESEYKNKKVSFEYPQVSYTEDNSKVWVCNIKNYIIATYNVRDVNEYIDLIICNKNYNERLNLDYEISNIYIDDVEIELDEFIIDKNHMIKDKCLKYKFDTLGEHKVLINFSKCENMDAMFLYCSGLTSLDFTSFDASNINNASSCVAECNHLSSITFNDTFGNVLKDFFEYLTFVNNVIVNYPYYADYSYKLLLSVYDILILPNPFGNISTHLVKVLDYDNNTYLSNINLTLSNGVEGVYNEELNGYTFTFENIKDVVEYDILKDGVKIDTLYTYIENQMIIVNCSKSIIKEIVISSDEYPTYFINPELNINILKTYINGDEVEPTPYYQFNTFSFHEIYLEVDMSNVSTLSGFIPPYAVYLDLSSLDTSNVTNMEGIFGNCYLLKTIIFGNKFNTSNVTNMNSMFYGCNSLTSLDLSSFDTRNVTDMSWMFCSCYFLKEIEGLNNFDTSNVTNMDGIFTSCFHLTSLDLSSFNTFKVTSMYNIINMTYYLSSITFGSLFDVSNVICETKYDKIIDFVVSNLNLIMCENIKSSWETHLEKIEVADNAKLTITYIDCSK